MNYLILLLFFQSPEIQIPDVIITPPGKMVKIQAHTAGKQVKWIVNDPAAEFIHFEKIAVFCSTTPGVYRVFAYTAIGDIPSDPAICTITVSKPTDPIPPPKPVDKETQAIRDAYSLDSDASKSGFASQLAALYDVASSKTVHDPAIKTYGDLQAKMKSASALLIPANAIPYTRIAISNLLIASFGTDSSKPIDRTLAQEAFLKVSKALKGVQ